MVELPNGSPNNLVQTKVVPGKAGSGILFDEQPATPDPVECLGMRFASDEARRAYYLERLKEHLPELRKRPDFPVGDDDDILRLSDPPYYTACPNPFLSEFVRRGNSTDHSTRVDPSTAQYHRHPYTGSINASSRHSVYSFHPYPTKVPPDVIRTLIDHYTEPGDLVFDGFCGTGMTGVAAREAGRNAILADLCPAATFISGTNTRSHNLHVADTLFRQLLSESRKKWGHLYYTRHDSEVVSANYYVWSDVFTCPECVYEFPFFPHGVIHHGTKVETRRSFPCPSCDAALNVRRVERVLNHEGKKSQLVWTNAGRRKYRINRPSNAYDQNLVKEIEQIDDVPWFPSDLVNPDGYSAKLAQLRDKAISDVSRYMTKRNRIVFSDLWERASAIADASILRLALTTLTSILIVISERQGYFGGGGGMSGNLYMPIVRMEKNIYDVLDRKLGKLKQAEQRKQWLSNEVCVTTESSAIGRAVPSNSIDYIYTDPPFGDNIIYSEMNLLLESWIRVKTNGGQEAVIDTTRSRDFTSYGNLMRSCFGEFHRILKPGRWMTVEFHNTRASVWNLIQTALSESGFVVAQVGVLDKGSTTILADIRPGAAKLDLLISSYKPNHGFETRFELRGGSEEGVWDFVEVHMGQLPVFLMINGQSESIVERHDYLLFDRMVAYHVQRGVMVPLSTTEFYDGLRRRFAERDGMFFLPDQVAEYDRRRISTSGVMQPEFFVNNEETAIQWLKRSLSKKPQTFKELHPQFIKELDGWQRHEALPELSALLEENFLCYSGIDEIPGQIHGYLSSNFKELRGREKGDSELRAKARDRWYVADSRKSGDLERLRGRALLKEFDDYRASPQRTLKVFRLEAIRAGFRRAWQDSDYRTIIQVARKIPEGVLQEDAKLLMWFDHALTRSGE